MKALVITPVKDSLETTILVLEAVSRAKGDFKYLVYNDFSKKETKQFLDENKERFNYSVVHIEEITSHPSPNYHLVLQLAQEIAVQADVPLIIIESDVIIKENTIVELITLSNRLRKPGLIGAITVNRQGIYNFPYASEKKTRKGITDTNRSLSFCCTLISAPYLNTYNFRDLSDKKDWFDIFISRQAKRHGFRNYLAKRIEVTHLPHSSRPWKQLKYTHPLQYYFYKLLKKRDKI